MVTDGATNLVTTLTNVVTLAPGTVSNVLAGATIAHRTSPTNMGLALLANLSAYDFGYIPAGQLLGHFLVPPVARTH